MKNPLVTAIVSTYCAEHFIRGCLEDLLAQTLIAEMEVLVIDSGSPQNESSICAEFAREHPQIRLIRTERESLYTAWNRAIALARGKYLTNTNTDDRHRSDFMEVMTTTLESRPENALAYADQFISHDENETYSQCEQRGARLRRWPDYTPLDLMLRCITGSQPVWRKSLHGELGVFDTKYRIAADYDLWLRFAERHPLFHVKETLGVLFDSPNTMSGANSRLQVNREILSIQRSCMRKAHWRSLPGVRSRLAAELFARGYQHIEQDKNLRAAEPFIREAIRLDPGNLKYIKTYALRCIAHVGL